MSIINQHALDHLSRIDSNFQNILNLYGLPPSWSRPPGFETLCKIILEQQVSLESARAAFFKLEACVDSFTPEQILRLDADTMKRATISRQKATYLLALSRSIIDGDLNLASTTRMSSKECLEMLTRVKGIGPWTANVYLMFALQHTDIFPPGDIALNNTVKELWQLENNQQVLDRSKSWQPFRTAASYLLWHYYLNKRGRSHPG